MRKALLLTLSVLLAGCARSAHVVPRAMMRPSAGASAWVEPVARIGVPERYWYRTHCGLTGLEFDHRWWKVSPPLSKDPYNPPPGWEQDPAVGSMTLISKDRAVLRSPNGHVAHLVPAPTPSPLPTGDECN